MVNVPLGPAELNFDGVRAGDLNEVRITIRAGGKPVDLTGQTLKAQAKHNVADVTGLDAVITVIDPLTGVITIRWPGSAVRTWLGTATSVKGVWDMELKSGTSDPVTIVAGTFGAEMDVTQ
jgi:hypothetical protein